MILAKISKAVREQNYYAVALEFLIVIAGVVIGFQITAWNSEREDGRAERVALEELLIESERIIEYLDAEIASYEGNNALRRRVVAALSAQDAEAVSEQEVRDALSGMRIFRPVTPPRSTYDGLAGSGGLSGMSDRQAVAAIAAYYSELATVENAVEYFQGFIVEEFANISDHPGILAYYDPDADYGRNYRIDFAEVAADEAFVEDQVNLLRNQLFFQVIRLRLLEQAEIMCRALATAAGRDCEARDLAGHP